MILMCNHGLVVMTGRTEMEAAFTPCRSGFFNLDQSDGFILVPVSGTEPAAVGPARL